VLLEVKALVGELSHNRSLCFLLNEPTVARAVGPRHIALDCGHTLLNDKIEECGRWKI